MGIVVKVVVGLLLFAGTLVGGLAATGRLNHDGVANIPGLNLLFPAPPDAPAEPAKDGETGKAGDSAKAGDAVGAPEGLPLAVASPTTPAMIIEVMMERVSSVPELSPKIDVTRSETPFHCTALGNPNCPFSGAMTAWRWLGSAAALAGSNPVVKSG